MRVATGLIAVALGLAACSTPSYPTATAPAAPPPSSATPETLPPAPPPRSAIPRPQAQARDACGAYENQRLVGRPRSEIPVPLDPGRQRVACTTCPVTEDFNAARLNFFFDAETGRIKQVRCG